MSKYHNEKVTVDGIRFDSKKEARRYTELKLLQKAGEITNLKRQVRYELIPKQKSEQAKRIVMPVYYVSDFEYDVASTGEHVVEDVKGIKTREFIIKHKLMLWRYNIYVKTV